jgi:cytochrome P450
MHITDGTDLLEPARYAAKGYPHEIWTRLRKESPVHWCEPAETVPFWAITKHAHIVEISKRPEIFENGAGIVPQPKDVAERIARGEKGPFDLMQTIITMDPPKHRKYRKVASPYFTPQALNKIDATVDASAKRLVNKLYDAQKNGEGVCDFVTEIAVPHPLRILCSILGIAEADEPTILRLTQQLFAADDPEFARPEADRQEAFRALGMEFVQYFMKIIAERRANPRPDLAGLLANAQVDGEPMGPMETLGYYLIVFTAGHDTTRNAIASGMQALLENPAQLKKLCDDPSLARSTVEEVVRWSTPVNYMRRRLLQDVELHGTKLHAGEDLAMFYASANRDDEVFDDPFEFDITRDPNPHLGFGTGEHFCLGAHVARLSSRALFLELARRIEFVEAIGTPSHIASSFVVGLKTLPIRYRIRAAR